MGKRDREAAEKVNAMTASVVHLMWKVLGIDAPFLALVGRRDPKGYKFGKVHGRLNRWPSLALATEQKWE